MRSVQYVTSLLLASSCSLFCLAQNVGIGTSTPSSSALLEVNSSSKGLLIPRMDNFQMRNIASPAEGLMVYNVSDSSFYTYKTRWRKLSVTLPFRDTVNSAATGFYVVQEGTGNGITVVNNNNKTAIAGFSQDLFSNPGASNSIGLMGVNLNTNNWGAGIYGQHNGTGIGIRGSVLGSDPNAIAVSGEAPGLSTGVKGRSATGIGVWGDAFSSGGTGVFGSSTGNSGSGVQGLHSGDGFGVSGESSGNGTGVYGNSNTGTGGRFRSATGVALKTEGVIRFTGIGESAGKVLIASSDGTANWGTITKTVSLNIPGSAFKSEISSAGYITTNGEAYSAGTGYQLLLDAPVILPDGATLLAMTAYVMDNTALKGISVSLVRSLNTGGMFPIATMGTTASDITGGYFPLAAGMSYTVNNYSEAYIIEVTTSDFTNWPGDLLRIKSVRIVYSYPVSE